MRPASPAPLRLERIDVEGIGHVRGHAVLLEDLLVFPADEGILVPIGNGGATVADVDGALVDRLLAGTAGLVGAMIVGAVPADQAQLLLAGAEMGVEPVAAERRRRHHADRLVVLAEHLVGLAVLPRREPERARPSIGVAGALDANE